MTSRSVKSEPDSTPNTPSQSRSRYKSWSAVVAGEDDSNTAKVEEITDLPPMDSKILEDINNLIKKRGPLSADHPKLKLIFDCKLTDAQKLAVEDANGIVKYFAQRHGERFFIFNNKLYSREAGCSSFEPWNSGLYVQPGTSSESSSPQKHSDSNGFSYEEFPAMNESFYSHDSSHQNVQIESSPSTPSNGNDSNNSNVLVLQIQSMVHEINNLKEAHAFALEARDKEIIRLQKEVIRLEQEKEELLIAQQANEKLVISEASSKPVLDQNDWQKKLETYQKEFEYFKKEYQECLKKTSQCDPTAVREAHERLRVYERFIIATKRSAYLKELRHYKYSLEEIGKILSSESVRFEGNRNFSLKLAKLEEQYNDITDKLIHEKERYDECFRSIDRELNKLGKTLNLDIFIELELPPLPSFYGFYQEVLDQIPLPFLDSLAVLQILAPLYVKGELIPAFTK